MDTPGMWELLVIMLVAGVVPIVIVVGVISYMVSQYRRHTKALEDLAAATREQSHS